MLGKPSISDYYRAVQQELEKTILQSDSQYILETDVAQIVVDLVKSNHVLHPIVFDASKKETMKHRKEMRRVPARMRDRGYGSDGDLDFEYEVIDVALPISPNSTIRQITDLDTSTHSMSWSTEDFHWNSDMVSFAVDIKGYGFKFEDDKVINEIAQMKSRIQEWTGWANKDIEQGNLMLEKNLTPFINDRKKKLSEDNDRIGGLSAKLGISLE